MDARLKNMEQLLTSYATGKFRKRVRLSKRLDDADAVFSALHMLAEQLEAVMVSRDYCDDIFNTIPYMMLVLTRQGRIEQVNNAVCGRLGFREKDLLGQSVEVLTGKGPSLVRQLQRRRGPLGQARIWNRSFLTAEGEEVPVEIEGKFLMSGGMVTKRAYLLTIYETSLRRARENEAKLNMIQGQEEERARLAAELHDGLLSQIAGAEYLIRGALEERDEEKRAALLHRVDEQLRAAQRELRDVCYQLVPAGFKERGLIPMVQELGERVGRSGVLRMEVEVLPGSPLLPMAVQIDVYRVIQEFLMNTLKHAAATHLLVRFSGKGRGFEVLLRENGKGFDMTGPLSGGMGIRNMHSRIRSHGGTFLLRSSRGKGSQGRICLTINE
jgi:PAS domain S-box-containing protein